MGEREPWHCKECLAEIEHGHGRPGDMVCWSCSPVKVQRTKPAFDPMRRRNKQIPYGSKTWWKHTAAAVEAGTQIALHIDIFKNVEAWKNCQHVLGQDAAKDLRNRCETWASGDPCWWSPNQRVVLDGRPDSPERQAKDAEIAREDAEFAAKVDAENAEVVCSLPPPPPPPRCVPVLTVHRAAAIATGQPVTMTS